MGGIKTQVPVAKVPGFRCAVSMCHVSGASYQAPDVRSKGPGNHGLK